MMTSSVLSKIFIGACCNSCCQILVSHFPEFGDHGSCWHYSVFSKPHDLTMITYQYPSYWSEFHWCLILLLIPKCSDYNPSWKRVAKVMGSLNDSIMFILQLVWAENVSISLATVKILCNSFSKRTLYRFFIRHVVLKWWRHHQPSN